MLTIAVRSACDTDDDVVTRIYNQGIADRIATFETRLRTPDELWPVVTSSQFPCMVATVARDVVGLLARRPIAIGRVMPVWRSFRFISSAVGAVKALASC